MVPKPPAEPENALQASDGTVLPERDEALPVVARLVVEIRSDGRRTIARGAMEDVQSGQRVAIDARAGSPLELASGLAKQMFQLPRMLLRSSSPFRIRQRVRAALSLRDPK